MYSSHCEILKLFFFISFLPIGASVKSLTCKSSYVSFKLKMLKEKLH